MTQVRVRQVLKRVVIPPLTDRRFWVVQLLTVLIDLATFTLWHMRLLVGLPLELAVPMIDVANLLFLVPVLYAALNFGLVGAVATAVLVAVFRGVFLIFWHDPIQLWILGAVYASVLAVAVFVGERVEQEVGARREAEAARNAASASEAQFRRLFEDSPAPTLLLDLNATIRRRTRQPLTSLGARTSSWSAQPPAPWWARRRPRQLQTARSRSWSSPGHTGIPASSVP